MAQRLTKLKILKRVLYTKLGPDLKLRHILLTTLSLSSAYLNHSLISFSSYLHLSVEQKCSLKEKVHLVQKAKKGKLLTKNGVKSEMFWDGFQTSKTLIQFHRHVPCVASQVLNVLCCKSRLPTVLIPHKPPPLSCQETQLRFERISLVQRDCLVSGYDLVNSWLTEACSVV